MANGDSKKEQSDPASPLGGAEGMDMHYHDYLQLERILNAQSPERNKQNLAAHDEMLFIIILNNPFVFVCACARSRTA